MNFAKLLMKYYNYEKQIHTEKHNGNTKTG